MNSSQLHLMLNHIPVIGSFLLALFYIHSQLWHRDYQKKNIFLAYIIVLLVIIPVYLSGDPSKEAIQNYAGISPSLIELHENFALASLFLIILIGLLSAFALYIISRQKTIPRWFNITFITVSVILIAVITFTAQYGGEIRHPEIL